MEIKDGQGNKGSAEVSARGQLSVNRETALAIGSARGDAYSWASIETDIGVGDTMLLVRNDSDRPLILDRMVVNGGNVIATWDIGIGQLTTTLAGTAVTGTNLNPTYSGKPADASAIADETAIADATVVDRVKTPVTNTVTVDLTGIVLEKGQYIQINQETESTSGSAILIAHYGD